MAQEIQASGALSFIKGGANLSASFSNTYFDAAGSAGVKNVASIGTSDETLALGDVSTIGWVYAKNLDATNFILLSADGTLYNIKLKPGEFFIGRWNGAAIHAKADTAACLMESLILPN